MNIKPLASYIFWKLKYSHKLLKYHGIHKGKSCFIIGNGPSLNKMDLSKLQAHYTFGLNKIYLMEQKVKLNLSYLVSVNDLVIEQSVNEFEGMKIPTFLSYRPASKINFRNPNIEYIYTGAKKPFQKNIMGKIREGATVTYVAMQIAYWMGFEKVILIGVDHSFKAEGKPHEKQVMKGNDINHFDPNYFKGQMWGLPDLETSEIYYNVAKQVYAENGREILDATVEGKLEVYPKITFEDALKQASLK